MYYFERKMSEREEKSRTKTLVLDLMYYFGENRIRKIKISSTKKDYEEALVLLYEKKGKDDYWGCNYFRNR